jgi:hypothetical protein
MYLRSGLDLPRCSPHHTSLLIPSSPQPQPGQGSGTLSKRTASVTIARRFQHDIMHLKDLL